MGRTVVASKSQSSALISSQSFQGTYLEAVVQATGVENCNNIAFPSRFQLARSGLKKFSQTISSFGHDIVDLSLLQSPFASARDPLFSMLETSEASANGEQIEKPQRTSQGQQSIQTDDSETKFEKWSTGRDRRCRGRGAVSKQTTLGQHITTSEDGCSWSCRTAAVKQHGGNYHCSGGCRQGCCSCRTVRSRSAYSSQGPQEGVGITAGFSRRAVAISRSQGRQNGDWASLGTKISEMDHNWKVFTDKVMQKFATHQQMYQQCRQQLVADFLQKSQEIQAVKEQVQNASVAMFQAHVTEPPQPVEAIDVDALFEAAQEDAYMDMEQGEEEEEDSELVKEKPRPPIGPFRKRLTPVSPTKVHTTHLKK